MMQSLSENVSNGKIPCPDCKMCQGCSESRCAACRAQSPKRMGTKLSIREQIALFNSINPGLQAGTCKCRFDSGQKS